MDCHPKQKKGGLIALPLERLRYQVLNKVRYAASLRFGGGPVIVTVNEEIVNKQVWVGTPMQFGNEIKQNMANVFVKAPQRCPVHHRRGQQRQSVGQGIHAVITLPRMEVKENTITC